MALHDDDLLLVNDSQDGNEAKKIKYSTLKSNIASDVGASGLQAVTNVGNHTTNDVLIGNTEASPNIKLDAAGLGEFSGGVRVTGGTSAAVVDGIANNGGNIYLARDGLSRLWVDDTMNRLSAPEGINIGLQIYNDPKVESSDSQIAEINNASSYYTTSNLVNPGGGSTPPIDNLYHFQANAQASRTKYADASYGFYVNNALQDSGLKTYGFHSNLNTGSDSDTENYNFYAAGIAPNFFAGDTHIGGNTSGSTRELWESTLTEEQKEQLAAGTFAIPADVSTPGDGTFARQWWYDQQSAEDQALIDSGELAYPEHLQAANFTDTFALGDNTNIKLKSDGSATLASGEVEVTTAGRLGLGTDSPKGLLHLEGDSIAETWFTSTGDGGSEWRIGAGDTLSGLHGGFRIYNATNSITAISAASTGNVGIGIPASPSEVQPLAVQSPGSPNTYVSLRSSTDTGVAGLSYGSPTNPTRAAARYLFSDDSYGILVAGSGTESFRISSDGKIFSQFGTGVGGTAAAPNITLNADGTIQAANLTDGVTTKTMTEVLAGGGAGEGSCISGEVAGNGSKIYGEGFTAVRNSKGNYTITFDVEQPDTEYTVVANARGNGRYNTYFNGKSTTSFILAVFNVNQNDFVDSDFNFIITSANLALPEVFSVPGATYKGIQGGIIFNGTTPEIDYGEGFSIVRDSKGSFTITFDEEMPSADYTVVGTLNYNLYNKGNFNVNSRTTTSFKVGTTTANESNDVPFSFAVLPSDLSGSNKNVPLYQGVMNSAGATLSGTGGFTTFKGNDGKYGVTFDTPMPDANYVALAIVDDPNNNSMANLNAHIYYKSETGFNIMTANANGNATNRSVAFVVWPSLGPYAPPFYLDSDNNRYYLNQQFTYNGVLYPKQGVTDDLLVNTLGFTRVQVAPKPSLDSQYYSVTGPNDDGSWTTAERDLAEVKVELVRNEKLNARSVLSKTDWLIIRRAENDSAIPTAVEEFRDDVRVVSNDRCVAIYAAPGISELQQLMGELDAYPAEVAGYDY